MARIKYSALVTEIAGSMGGTTFQRNAYGFTIKNKPNMVKPNRARQIVRKVDFQANVKRWRELTQSNRDAWIAYATTYPVPSRLNPDSYLNGFNAFVRYHNYLSVYNRTAVLADPSGAQGAISDYAADVLNIDDELTWEPTATVSGSNWIGMVYLTNVQGAGQTFVKDTPIFMGYKTAPFSGSLDVTSKYLDTFGNLPPVGSFIGLKVVFLKLDTGQAIVIPVQRQLVDG